MCLFFNLFWSRFFTNLIVFPGANRTSRIEKDLRNKPLKSMWWQMSATDTFTRYHYKVWGEKKQHTFKNWPLIKNTQFLSYPHETWSKKSPHEVIIFTKFHKDRTKIWIFHIKPNFECVSFFFLRLYVISFFFSALAQYSIWPLVFQ